MAEKDNAKNAEVPKEPGVIATVAKAVDNLMHPHGDSEPQERSKKKSFGKKEKSVEQKRKPVSGPGGDYYLGETK